MYKTRTTPHKGCKKLPGIVWSCSEFQRWKRNSCSSLNGFVFAFEKSLSSLDCFVFHFRKVYRPNSLVSLRFLAVFFSSSEERAARSSGLNMVRHVRIKLYACAPAYVIVFLSHVQTALCLCLCRTCKPALKLHAKIIAFQNWQIFCWLELSGITP